MSKHHNYNNYSKPANNNVEKTEPEVRTENLEDEIPVSETDTEIQEAKEKVERTDHPHDQHPVGGDLRVGGEDSYSRSGKEY